MLAFFLRFTYRGHSMAGAKCQRVGVLVGPNIKSALQSAAEGEMRSLANVVEFVMVTYCKDCSRKLGGIPEAALRESSRRGRAA
jgi:hypothetical protein